MSSKESQLTKLVTLNNAKYKKLKLLHNFVNYFDYNFSDHLTFNNLLHAAKLFEGHVMRFILRVRTPLQKIFADP
jgi:hypothetical protein